ncbi:kinase-like domain-containing protein [Lentinula detonsa]|uniref:Kinase-like domain-containing protein n=1 Tax=Lentinula detonsa TaxID=2804962 RepID=A0AA38Q3N5_9AGAR|nr:kinase-like domain-containing protein [Lentinula detonsa]
MSLFQNDDGDGCGRVFENKSGEGLCAKCRKLGALSEGSNEYNAWKGYAQCIKCGIAWKNFQGGICGTCESKSQCNEIEEITLEKRAQIAAEATRKAHLIAVDSRLHKHKEPSPLHNTAALDAAKANSASSAADKDRILITFSCRVKTGRAKDTVDFSAGTWGKAWAKTDYISEVMDDALATLNLGWEKREGMSLLVNEAELRWSGNKVLMPNTLGLQVYDFIKAHTQGSEGFFYELSETKGKGEKSKKDGVPPVTVALELYIDKAVFVQRKEHMSVPTLKTTVVSVIKKRRGTDSIFNEHSAVGRADGMVSSFVRTPRILSLEQVTTSQVSLIRARVVCDAKTGEVDISWPGKDDNADEYIGSIGDSVFSSGRTKHVYKLTIKDDLLVAKRFFNCGNGIDEVTAAENESSLIAEITRLKSTAWLLEQFKKLALTKDVDIHQELAVSEAWLFRELNTVPSKASGLLHNVFADAVWLVEPRRTKSVDKYSSTLVHPRHGDKKGITISAFAHYVFVVNQEELALADIQGSLVNIEGIDTVVLFDIMFHTEERDSGVGDHGPAGIKTFMDQHKCTYICDALGLEMMNQDELEEED